MYKKAEITSARLLIDSEKPVQAVVEFLKLLLVLKPEVDTLNISSECRISCFVNFYIMVGFSFKNVLSRVNR